MSSDFIFVDPNKIPPRRSVKEGGSRNIKVRRIPRANESFDSEADEDQMESPEFILNPREFQIHFAAHNPIEIKEEIFHEDLDPLTQEIFFVPKPRPMPAPPPVFEFKKEEVFFPKHKEEEEIDVVQVSESIQDEPDTNSREAILAELERIDSNDTELFKKIKRLNTPKRASHINLVGSFPTIIKKDAPPGIKMRFLRQRMLGKKQEVVFDSNNEFLEDTVRAEDDWFQVRTAASERVSTIRNLAENIRENRLGSIDVEEEIRDYQNEKKKNPRTYIAVIFIILIPVVASIFLFSSKQNFLKSAFNSINSKFLGSSSFVIINSESSTVFPGISEAKAKLAGSGVPEETGVFFDKFFEENSSFSWLNIFKKKAIGQTASIAGLDFLEKAKESIKSVTNPSLDPVEKDLEKEISKLNFWKQFLFKGNQYLIVLLDSEVSRPVGGKPVSYALVKSNGDFLETTGSGKFLALDAASDLKKIPPEPVQVFSTSWMPSDSGWFLNFPESGETFSNFFENITQTKVNGVLAIDKNFLKQLSFRESIIFDIESQNWFYGFVDALERKPNHRWVGLADEIEKALKSHEAQFYFSDPNMNAYALNSNWLASTKISAKEDIIGIAWATFQGSGMALELIESRNSIESDGSVLENLNIMMKQGASGASKNYFKIYIPKGSEIKNISGFSEKEKIPEFDYLSKGFSADTRIKPNIPPENDSWNVDVFEESGLTVIGGWIDAKSQERKKISLEYSLPFKLVEKNGYMTYSVKVLRPMQNEDTPFRFNLLPKKGVQILSLDPNGFVTENLGEYQGNLNSDLNLGASLMIGE